MSKITRRRALQILTVGGLTTTIVIPSRWIKPVVEAVVVRRMRKRRQAGCR
jgi:hypothetical protein